MLNGEARIHTRVEGISIKLRLSSETREQEERIKIDYEKYQF